MRLFRNKFVWIFLSSVLIGFLLVAGMNGYGYWQRLPKVQVTQLDEEIGLAGQIQSRDLLELHSRGYATVIDLRPDGEAPDQPASSEINTTAGEQQIKFFYIPVPHGDAVPEAAVSALGKALASSPKPVLLYCRSGRRAARAWSLAEASRPGGLDAAGIRAAVKAAGHSVDDLAPLINARIEKRKASRT